MNNQIIRITVDDQEDTISIERSNGAVRSYPQIRRNAHRLNVAKGGAGGFYANSGWIEEWDLPRFYEWRRENTYTQGTKVLVYVPEWNPQFVLVEFAGMIRNSLSLRDVNR